MRQHQRIQHRSRPQHPVRHSPTDRPHQLGPSKIDGAAIAAWNNYVVIARGETSELTIVDLAASTEKLLSPEDDGRWHKVGGPSIPSDAQPLPTVSINGQLLVAQHFPESDANGDPERSSLHIIDLETGETALLESFDKGAPLATWSTDGTWVVLIERRDLTLQMPFSDNEAVALPGAIPDEHFAMSVG